MNAQALLHSDRHNTQHRGDIFLLEVVIWFIYHLTQKTHFPQTLRFIWPLAHSPSWALPHPTKHFIRKNQLIDPQTTLANKTCLLHTRSRGLMRNSLQRDVFRSRKGETTTSLGKESSKLHERLKQKWEPAITIGKEGWRCQCSEKGSLPGDPPELKSPYQGLYITTGNHCPSSTF